MANSTDKSILTAAGKALLAQLNAEEKALVIDKMIFANVPNRPEYPQPDDVVPTDHIVHQEQVEQRGRLSADSVIYSTTLTSDVGPFDFNWTGAYCSEYGVLVTIDHHALTPKTADEPGVAGNTLVRSVVLEYKDIAEITNITVDASSWQYNATERMKKMDSDVAQSIIDQNGKDWFIEDGFLVTPSGSAYSIKAGAGYVSGNRIAMEFDRSVQVPNKPSFIYIDAHREGTPTGEQVTIFNFVVTAEEKDDYIDSSTGKDVKHFVCKIAEVHADGSVSDHRVFRNADKFANHASEETTNTLIFPSKMDNTAKVGDLVPVGTTGIRDGKNKVVYSVFPSPVSGLITKIDFNEGKAEIGGNNVELTPIADIKLQRATDIPSITKPYLGQLVRWLGYYKVSDGGSNWGVVCKGPHIHDGFSIFSIDHNTYVRANLKGKSLNIRKAGAKGDKKTDDTDKIKLVISYAENNVVSRWDSGLTVRIPEGDFLISATLVITTSNIGLWGGDWSSCVLYAPDADFDLVHFDGTTEALYGCSGGKFRFNTPGNAKNGAHLRTTRLINSDFSSLYYVGYHKGLVSDGCARTYYSNQIFSQETRDHNTSPSYAMDFTSYNGANNSDVHVNTYQIFMPDDRKCRYSVSIRGGDGIYLNDGHQQGGTLVQPDGEGTKVCASVYWNRVYMDKADDENIIFTRGSEIYRNFQFNSTYLRGSERGLVFDTTSNIEKIKYIGGEISGHTKSGIECRNDKVRKLKVVGADFDTNCSDNVLGDSDIIVRGNGHVISANNFSGGSSNGRAVNLTNESSNCIVCSNDFSESTQDIRLINSGYENKIGVNTGVTFKNKGTATVVKGSRRVTVPHGMTQSPTYDAFQITPRTEITPAQSFWLENVTSESFDIVLTSEVQNNAVFSWLCDLTG